MALTPELQEFIARHIDSIASMEVLLLLLSAAPPRSPEEIAGTLGITTEAARAILGNFVDFGLLAMTDAGAYLLSPASERALALAWALAREYSVHRIDVINAIYSAGLLRLRAFADAFKLRKP